MTYDVRLTSTGDSAEADDLGAALRTARQLVDDVASYYDRGHRSSLLITQDGTYDGLATTLAREGRAER